MNFMSNQVPMSWVGFRIDWFIFRNMAVGFQDPAPNISLKR